MKNKTKAVLLSLQIVYEYPEWGWEHISDMLSLYESPEKPPCDGDELWDLCIIASRHKKAGLSYDDAKKEMLKK